jgi:hypothetical protein
MKRRRWIEESEVLEVVGKTVPVRGFCQCRRTTLPLRGVEKTVEMLAEAVRIAERNGLSPLDGDMDFQTARCRDCKKIIRISLGDLGIVEK